MNSSSRFKFGEFELSPPFALTVSRTGFTGDLGYELWMPPRAAECIWDALMSAGHSRGIRAIGAAALNLSRADTWNISLESEERSP